MTILEKTLKLATSFVYKDFKPINDEGSGEAKIYVGSTSEQEEFNDFFGFNDKQTIKYKFVKNNLLDYLQQVKLEYVYQFFNKYKNINIDTWNNNYNSINSLNDDLLYIDLRSHVDQRRYYIRSDNDLFKNTLRKMSIPKLTNIKFQKHVEENLMLILLEVDYSYNISENMAGDDECQTHFGENRIFYGVPGSGKSYFIKHNYSLTEDNSIRVVFHPDYTYSDFVGQILPKISKGENGSEDKLKYEFSPGPFVKILKKAYNNPNQPFYIEFSKAENPNVKMVSKASIDLDIMNAEGTAHELEGTFNDVDWIAKDDPIKCTCTSAVCVHGMKGHMIKHTSGSFWGTSTYYTRCPEIYCAEHKNKRIGDGHLKGHDFYIIGQIVNLGTPSQPMYAIPVSKITIQNNVADMELGAPYSYAPLVPFPVGVPREEVWEEVPWLPLEPPNPNEPPEEPENPDDEKPAEDPDKKPDEKPTEDPDKDNSGYYDEDGNPIEKLPQTGSMVPVAVAGVAILVVASLVIFKATRK